MINDKKRLAGSVGHKYVTNPSAQEVWVTESDTGDIHTVKAG
jgi:hypothetical protein